MKIFEITTEQICAGLGRFQLGEENVLLGAAGDSGINGL